MNNDHLTDAVGRAQQKQGLMSIHWENGAARCVSIRTLRDSVRHDAGNDGTRVD